MIKAVIFDLDGTILDSLDAFWRAFNAGVATFKLEPVAREPLLALMNRGASLAEILGEFYPALKAEPASHIDEIMVEIRKEYLARSEEEVELAGGAQEILSQLRLRGLKIGVVTGRAVPPERQWRELTRLQVVHFIDVMVTGAKAKRKPAPDTIIECLKRLELLPEECILVGDSQVDIIAGRTAGVRTVAVATGVTHLQALAAESPDFIFDNLHGFMDKLDLILGGH